MPFDRAAILREAHATARWTVATYRAAGTLAVSGITYRKAFATALRSAWHMAKERAELEAFEASLGPIPTDVAARIRAMEADAWAAPITSRGNAEYAALMGQASLMRDAAREAALGLSRTLLEPADQFTFAFAAGGQTASPAPLT